jgi:hypothetical protein
MVEEKRQKLESIKYFESWFSLAVNRKVGSLLNNSVESEYVQ